MPFRTGWSLLLSLALLGVTLHCSCMTAAAGVRACCCHHASHVPSSTKSAEACLHCGGGFTFDTVVPAVPALALMPTLVDVPPLRIEDSGVVMRPRSLPPPDEPPTLLSLKSALIV